MKAKGSRSSMPFVDSEVLQKLIAASGMQQQEVAQRAGISRYHMSNLASRGGRCRVRPKTASGLAGALGVSVDVLAGDEPVPTSRARDSYSELSEVEREVLRIFRCLPLIKQAHALLKLQKYLPPAERVPLDDEDDE